MNFEILVDHVMAPRIISVPPTNRLADLLLTQYPNFSTIASPLTSGTTLLNPPEGPILKLIGDATNLGSTTEDRYRNYMRHLRANQYFQWLQQNPYFKKARDFFHGKQQAKRPNPYRTEWAEFQFLTVAAWAGLFILDANKNRRPRTASSRERRRAFSRAKRLQESIEDGIRLDSYSDQQTFSRLLVRFIDELGSGSYVKPRSDATLVYRRCVKTLTESLLACFSEASPTLVTNFAAMVGYDADPSTIERQKRKVEKDWQKRQRDKVAEAMSRVSQRNLA